jgi:hypothetical protein
MNPILVDLVTKIEYNPIKDGVRKVFSVIKEDYTNWSKLISGKAMHIKGRFVLKGNKNIFTLINVDTGIEYECISNTTIFLHLNTPYNDNEAKYVYELRKGRQKVSSIAGIVLKMKGTEISRRVRNTKYKSTLLSKLRDENKIKYRIKLRLYKRIYDALLRNSIKKNTKTEILTGCNSNELSEYLSSKFSSGMSFNNYGEWHVDHIMPCSSFDLAKEDEQRKCFHYTNLQPIWATSKIAKKYSTYDYEGNKNKGDSTDCVDYHCRELVMKTIDGTDISKEELLEKSSIMSSIIHHFGYRKFLQRDVDIIDNSNEVPMQDGSL